MVLETISIIIYSATGSEYLDGNAYLWRSLLSHLPSDKDIFSLSDNVDAAFP